MDKFINAYKVINKYRSKTPRGFYDKVKGHTGIDLEMPIGTPIILPIPVKVIGFKVQNQMGNTLYVEDANKNCLVFAHLSEVLVKTGDRLPEGTTLALSGDTGSVTTGPHLHFEIVSTKPEAGGEMMERKELAVKGYNIDPVKYMQINFQPHFSQEAMNWALEHKLIGGMKDPASSVNWGEFLVVIYRLAKLMIEWTSNTPKDATKTTGPDAR